MTETNVPPPPVAPADPAGTPAIEYGGATGYPGPYVGPAPDANAKTMGMLCHLIALAGFVIPFGTIIGPIIMWQVKKKDHPFIDDQGKEAVNFSITAMIAIIVGFLSLFILIGILLLPAIAITWLVFVIIATIKANQGIAYRYPFAIRFVK
jgi:uncharacterized Tic20 family protein